MNIMVKYDKNLNIKELETCSSIKLEVTLTHSEMQFLW